MAVNVKTWLEIGPGPFGVLTQKILKRDRDSKVVAIETVQESVIGFKWRMADYINTKRVKVSDRVLAICLTSSTCI